jgi:O-acetyl-ADP-ribose deacetylase (regulator of RNase III)
MARTAYVIIGMVASVSGLVVNQPRAARVHGSAMRAPLALERRALLARIGTASTATLAAAVSVSSPAVARAAVVAPKRDEAELKEAVVLIVRVIEATEQEERLINSGKYKDLQRKSVKNAAAMMLENCAALRRDGSLQLWLWLLLWLWREL